MGSLNKVMLIGNTGRDAEMRYLSTGTAKTDFSLAVGSRRRGQNGEWEEQTEWFNVVLFGDQAERISQYITKGKQHSSKAASAPASGTMTRASGTTAPKSSPTTSSSSTGVMPAVVAGAEAAMPAAATHGAKAEAATRRPAGHAVATAAARLPRAAMVVPTSTTCPSSSHCSPGSRALRTDNCDVTCAVVGGTARGQA